MCHILIRLLFTPLLLLPTLHPGVGARFGHLCRHTFPDLHLLPSVLFFISWTGIVSLRPQALALIWDPQAAHDGPSRQATSDVCSPLPSTEHDHYNGEGTQNIRAVVCSQ